MISDVWEGWNYIEKFISILTIIGRGRNEKTISCNLRQNTHHSIRITKKGRFLAIGIKN